MLFESLSTLRKDEARTVRNSKRDFKNELDFVKEGSEVFIIMSQIFLK